MQYKYLFPFEKIPMGSSIVLYGAGIMGQEYLKQLLITKYAEVICFIDRDYEKFSKTPVPVHGIKCLPHIEFDYIVIALRTGTFADGVCKKLIEMGIHEKKIVCVLSRAEPNVNVGTIDSSATNQEPLSIDSSSTIAIKLSRALGDNIIRKKIAESIINTFENIKIDIYSPAAEDLLKNVYNEYLECGAVRLIQDGGYLYNQNLHQYIAAIAVYDYLQVDFDDAERLQSFSPLLYSKIQLLKQRCDEQKMNETIPIYTFFARAMKKKKNCYTVFDYDGVFDIQNKRVQIALNPSYQQKFVSLQLNRYITINYGNAISHNESLVIAKQWPLDYFHAFAALFKKAYPDVSIVQLGGSDAAKIRNVDQYVLGERIELVEHILKNSFLHVDIEGGLVHLATQLGTKCVVLFGPTPVAYWGYEENINITAGGCHNCYGMYTNINQCARNMEKPECMWTITPEMVMERVEEYMENVVKRDYIKYRAYIDNLGLKEALVCNLRNHSDIVTDVEIAKDQKSNNTFEIKFYLNPSALIQSADDPRLKAVCENIIGNLALCTRGHVGALEYQESDIHGRKSFHTDIECKLTVLSNEENLEAIRKQLSENHTLTSWELMYRMAMLSNDDVTRFILLYAIINGVLESGERRAGQGKIDSFIRQKCREKGKNDYLGETSDGDTIYTSLRNAISHAKPERETTFPDVYVQIHDTTAKLAEIALWAVQEIEAKAVDA